MHQKIFIGMALWLFTQPIRAAEIRHRFLAKDESRDQLLLVDQNDPAKNWTLKLNGKGRDLQLVGKNLVLISAPSGYWEYCLADQKLTKAVNGYPGTMSARRQPDGHTYLACVQKEVTLYELDATDKLLRKVTFPVPTTRIIRQTPQGTILFGCKTQLFEGEWNGKLRRTITLPEGTWVYQALQQSNGHWLVSGGYNPKIFKLDADGTILKTIGGKESLEAKKYGFSFFGAMQVLLDGEIVVCNWTGHGANDSTKGAQLLQFDKSGRVVWSWHHPELAGSIHGVLILDDLNPAVLHDDVTSVLGPITPRR